MMTREELKRIALTADEKTWPAIRAAYLEERRSMPIEQRLNELDDGLLLMSVGFLRLEKIVGGLASFADRVKGALWGRL
jgi:hypothetical protein